MDEFISGNAWGIIIGGIGLAVNAGMIYATVKASLMAVTAKVETHNTRINAHSDRLSELERNQAERLGYERAMREHKG
jgi:cytochrome c-type biogenesis protein CcmH/NrfG